MLEEIPAIILAGGLGKRLRSIVSDRPKVMIPINDRPFMNYLLIWLKKYGITNVYISVGYMKDIIMDYYADGKSLGVNLKYIKENIPLGTGGALKKIVDVINYKEFILLNGDSMLPINMNDFYTYHKKSNAVFSMACYFQKECSNYGAIEYDKNLFLKKFSEKTLNGSGWINGGIYIVNSEEIKKYCINNKCSLEIDILPEMIKSKCVKIYLSNINKFIDIGNPDSLDDAKTELRKGII